MRLGYRNVRQFPFGYHGWQALNDPENAQPAPKGPLEGDFFPQCRLALLQAEKDAAYLGLSPGSRYFSLSDISVNYLLLEVYNEMCTLCLAELPNIKRLFHLVASEGEMNGRIKMMGLGAGSTKRSVAKFRRQKGYDLPLFADEKWTVFGLLGKPVLPILYLLKKSRGKGFRIILRHEGGIGDPKAFLLHLRGLIKPEMEAAK